MSPVENKSSSETLLQGVESLKQKVAAVPTDVDISKKAAKEADHDILMDMANKFTSFIPEMLSFKSSFEEFRTEITALRSQLKAFEDENKEIKRMNADLKKENAGMKKQLLDYEIEHAQKSIIVKSLPTLDCREDRETNEMLQESFGKVMTQMKVNGKVQISDIYRLKSKDKKGPLNGGSLFSPVKVQFQSMIDKRNFFKNIRNIKGSIFNEIQINQCVVKSMENDYRELDKTAFDLRQATPGLKYNIVISKQKYKLMIKNPQEKKFSEYEG